LSKYHLFGMYRSPNVQRAAIFFLFSILQTGKT